MITFVFVIEVGDQIEVPKVHPKIAKIVNTIVLSNQTIAEVLNIFNF